MYRFYILAFSLTMFLASCSQQAPKEASENNVDADSGAVVEQPKRKFKVELRKELNPFFTHQKQDDIVTQVRPKGLSFDADAEGIYAYFFIRKGKALSLKLHIQFPEYKADLIELHVDDAMESYEVNQSYSARGGMLNTAESYSKSWYDKAINMSDVELLRKISTANNVSLVFKHKEGGTVLGTINLSSEQRQSLVRALDYYDAQENSATIPKKGMVNIRS